MYRFLSWIFTLSALLLFGTGLFCLVSRKTKPNGMLTVEALVQDLGSVKVGIPQEIVFRFFNTTGTAIPIIGTEGL
jgi:hypothetical protein